MLRGKSDDERKYSCQIDTISNINSSILSGFISEFSKITIRSSHIFTVGDIKIQIHTANRFPVDEDQSIKHYCDVVLIPSN